MPTNIRASTSTNGGVFDPASGDGILDIYTGATSGAQVKAVSIDAGGQATLLKAPKLDATAVVSMVRAQGANGFGSTNTVIRRFTNVLTNQGSDITYTDSATLGGSFTINTPGVYAISATENVSAGSWAGLTLNTTQPTVGISTISNTSEVLDYNVQPNANYSIGTKWTGYLAAGAVIRLHTDGTSAGTSQARGTNFTIVKVA